MVESRKIAVVQFKEKAQTVDEFFAQINSLLCEYKRGEIFLGGIKVSAADFDMMRQVANKGKKESYTSELEMNTMELKESYNGGQPININFKSSNGNKELNLSVTHYYKNSKVVDENTEILVTLNSMQMNNKGTCLQKHGLCMKLFVSDEDKT